MKVKDGLLYSENHEWVEVNGNQAKIGITDYAQHHLGDIVFVELPEEGDEVDKEASLCTIESVKAASDVYAPISCEVVEANDELEDEPALVNEKPYEAYICQVLVTNPSELETLMDANAYREFTEEE